jgi:hypothetical protein
MPPTTWCRRLDRLRQPPVHRLEAGQLCRPVEAFLRVKVQVQNPRADRLPGRTGDQGVRKLPPPCLDPGRIDPRVFEAVLGQGGFATRQPVIAGEHRPAIAGDREGCSAGFREARVRGHAGQPQPQSVSSSAGRGGGDLAGTAGGFALPDLAAR